MISFGILDEFLQDKAVTEIIVNGNSPIYVERGGILEKTAHRFVDNDEIFEIIETILQPLGKSVSPQIPYADARLPDGSRVHVIIPPASLTGPMITIRKFSSDVVLPDALVEKGSMSAAMKNFLQICVKNKKNIIVSGGTGSGKTTLLNVLSSFIPSNERILTIEDTAELKLNQEHVGRLEARPPEKENDKGVTIQQLVINALRMRPDRIVVGECRSGEALDMLQAMNTGHEGSMTTIHANTPRDCLKRIEVMVMMAGYELPLRAIREQISSSINLIVQTSRFRDGSRKVSQIVEVTGMEGDTITISPIFEFKDKGIDKNTGKVIGQFVSTGIIPSFVEVLRARGEVIPPEMFG